MEGGHKYVQKAFKMGAQNCFEEAFWGSWALFSELWADFGVFLTMLAPFVEAVARFFEPWLFFSGPRCLFGSSRLSFGSSWKAFLGYFWRLERKTISMENVVKPK